MAKKSTSSPTPRRRRSTTPLTQLPGLFDNIEIDMSHIDSGETTVADARRRHVSSAATRQSFEIDPETLVRPSTLRLISFGSGSSGNCYYLGYETREGKTRGILIDAGVEPDIVYTGLKDNKIDIKTISAILLTHDHSDHVKYVYPILRANRHMVVCTTMRTMGGLLRRHNISNRIKEYQKLIYKEFQFKVSGFNITAFETSHDGTENVGYYIETPDECHHFVIATDTGRITERADYYMRQANYIIIESNYDLQMLHHGPYPEYLKARIEGNRGHLDNKVAAEYIKSIYSPSLTHVFLCHLSEENNTPEIALDCMKGALTDLGLRIGDSANPLTSADVDISVTALPRIGISPMFIMRRR